MCKRSEPWVASSVDGLLVFCTSSADMDRIGCVEIKTMTSRTSLEDAKDRSKQTKYAEVCLESLEAPSTTSGMARPEKVDEFH